ncbi:MAG: oligopeptide/dipeptide ABC transporter ATP-binding protein, partial [Pseudomonadota bacterium]
ITHDLGVVAGIADHVAVMYGGAIVEEAPVGELFDNPQHPYTRALLQTLPSIEPGHRHKLYSIPGQPPHLGAKPQSCPFGPRCAEAFERCGQVNPALIDVSAGHRVACHWDPSSGEPRNA